MVANHFAYSVNSKHQISIVNTADNLIVLKAISPSPMPILSVSVSLAGFSNIMSQYCTLFHHIPPPQHKQLGTFWACIMYYGARYVAINTDLALRVTITAASSLQTFLHYPLLPHRPSLQHLLDFQHRLQLLCLTTFSWTTRFPSATPVSTEHKPDYHLRIDLLYLDIRSHTKPLAVK